MKKIILLIGLCLGLFSITNVHAQSLRWGGSGGSSAGTTGADETVVDMATDPNGNVYVLWRGGKTGVAGPTTYYVDGHTVPGYGGGDIVLTSYRCDGTYRWTKVFGGTALDVPGVIKTDSLGGVYVTGIFGVHYINIHLDTDTTWATSASYKQLFLVKYDTAGNYQWLRMPEADTVGVNDWNFPMDMDIDGSGNIYWMCNLYPGSFAGGSYVVTSAAMHVLEYNSSGTFLSGTKLQITSGGASTNGLFMKRDFSLGRYYITGSAPFEEVSGLTFNGTPITEPLFIGAFDNTGALLWKKENTSGLGAPFGRAAIDANHDIYLAGNSQAFGGAVDTFNGYQVINPVSINGNAPLVVKMDSAGNNIWAKNAASQYATFTNSVTLNGSSVTVAGAYNGELLCPGFDSLNHPFMSGMGYDVFIVQLDAATGNFTKLDSITSGLPDDEEATAITADRHGNAYIGGFMDGDVYINGDTLISNGGGSDFLVAKFGYDNCGCTTTPTASYSYSGSPTVNFTYTGTTSGLDSVVWNFGDGGHAIGTTASHTYDTGIYNACVTAYTSCGSNIYCQNISIGSSAVSNVAFQNMAVYPNPAQDALFIENAPMGAAIKLFNIMGQQVYSGTITSNKQQLNTTNLPGGSYILQFTDKDGNRMNRTIVKQ